MHRTRSFVQKYLKERAGHFQVLFRQNIGAFSLQALANASLLGLGRWLGGQSGAYHWAIGCSRTIVAGVMGTVFRKLASTWRAF